MCETKKFIQLENPEWYSLFHELKSRIEEAHTLIVTSRHLFATLLDKQNTIIKRDSLSNELNGGIWIFHFNSRELGEFLALFYRARDEKVTNVTKDLGFFIPTFRLATNMSDRYTNFPKTESVPLPDTLSRKPHVTFISTRADYIQRDHTISPPEWKQAGPMNTKQTVLIQLAVYATTKESPNLLLMEKHSVIENVGGHVITIPSPISWHLVENINQLNLGEEGRVNCLALLVMVEANKKKAPVAEKENIYRERNKKLKECFKTSISSRLASFT